MKSHNYRTTPHPRSGYLHATAAIAALQVLDQMICDPGPLNADDFDRIAFLSDLEDARNTVHRAFSFLPAARLADELFCSLRLRQFALRTAEWPGGAPPVREMMQAAGWEMAECAEVARALHAAAVEGVRAAGRRLAGAS